METAETQVEDPGQASGPPPLPTGKPWGFWATLGLTFVNIICAGTSMIALIILAICILWFVGGDDSFVEAVQAIVSEPIVGWVSMVPGSVVGLCLIFLFVRARKTLGIAEYLALYPVPPRTFFAWLALAGGAVLCLQVATTLLTGSIGIEKLPSIVRDYPPVLAGLLVVPGSYGALLIWGFLYRGCSESALGPNGAVLLISLAIGSFYMLTGQPVRVIPGVLCMALVGWTRIGTGSVYMPLAIHLLTRIISIAVQIAITLPEE